MSGLIMVDAEQVRGAATAIKNINDDINKEYDKLISFFDNLGTEWNSEASTYALSKFYEIKDKYYTPRYEVMNQFVNFMNNQVATGYENTENVNSSMMENFR